MATEPKEYEISVRYIEDPEPWLEISEPEITLDSETSAIHSAVWRFEGVESLIEQGWSAAIKFKLLDNGPVPRYSGPFTNLCSTRNSVIACGNSGYRGTYSYRAVLEPPTSRAHPEADKPIRSERATIINQVDSKVSSTIKVYQHPDNSQVLLVRPEKVSLAAGQCLIWEVVQPPKDIPKWYPRLLFYSGPERRANLNRLYGPFTSLDTRNNSILAGGSGAAPGQYQYLFQMICVETGNVLGKSSGDPTIDDEGDPIPSIPSGEVRES
ncbi:MAG: hypothetical protein K0U98_04415 [Deltaproteobacteria bacterium]|nr:hypothetical protein [Deltaproteobacteria bacterium]